MIVCVCTWSQLGFACAFRAYWLTDSRQVVWVTSGSRNGRRNNMKWLLFIRCEIYICRVVCWEKLRRTPPVTWILISCTAADFFDASLVDDRGNSLGSRSFDDDNDDYFFFVFYFILKEWLFSEIPDWQVSSSR